MAETFTQRFQVRWGEIDFLGHMKNTAYLDLCPDVRMLYFESRGFSVKDFDRLRVGPVVRRDQVEYFRELRLLEPFNVDVALAGLSPDGSRFALRNSFTREDGQLAARVTSEGGWLDLEARRLRLPPPGLLEALEALARAEDFQELPSSLKA